MSQAVALLATIIGAGIVAAGPVSAEPPHDRGHKGGSSTPHHETGGSGTDIDIGIDVIFGSQDRDRIRDYYGRYPTYGGKPLPPGMRNRLAQGKPLPPGIAKQVFPGELRTSLHISEGYEPYIVGEDVVLIAIATGVIVDIIRDVF